MTDLLSTVSTSDSGPAPLPSTCIGLRIIAHPDLHRVGQRAVLFDPDSSAERTVSRLEPNFRDATGQDAGALGTARVSRTPMRIRRKRDGTLHLVAEPGVSVEVDGEALSGPLELDAERVRAGVPVVLGKDVALWLGQQSVESDEAKGSLTGSSVAMLHVRRQIALLAGVDSPVLLRGESGVGKELVARAIHDQSRRAPRPFVAVNMAAITAGVAGSQLFGHGKGAFTGATQAHGGFFRDAHTGTLFLDEIGDVAVEVQVQLLRAIEQSEVQTIGARTSHVDVRLIAATESNLEDAVANRTFRTALLERFVHEIQIPPLRERREDIGILFNHFLKMALVRFGAEVRLLPPGAEEPGWVPARFVAELARQAWPGNVRQLRNLAERFALENRDRRRAVGTVQMQRAPSAAPPSGAASDAAVRAEPKRGSQVSDDLIRAALRESGWVINKAARLLAIPHSTLHRYLQERDIARRGADLTVEEITIALRASNGDPVRAALMLEVSPRALGARMKRLSIDRDNQA